MRFVRIPTRRWRLCWSVTNPTSIKSIRTFYLDAKWHLRKVRHSPRRMALSSSKLQHRAAIRWKMYSKCSQRKSSRKLRAKKSTPTVNRYSLPLTKNYGFRRNKKAGSPTKPSTIKIEKPQVINREVQKDKCSCWLCILTNLPIRSSGGAEGFKLFGRTPF